MGRLTAELLRPGSGLTLFAVAGAGGGTDELTPVAAALAGDPRVIALAPRAVPGSDDTVESMAVELVGAIRAEQPQGPYHLVGYSFGGLLALEAARLLVDARQELGLVAIVDTFFDQRYWPTGLFVQATARRAAVHARVLGRQPLGPALHDLSGRAWRLSARVRARGRDADPTSPLGARNVQDANLAVMGRWRPSVFTIPVTLIAATTLDFGCRLADLWRPWLPHLQVQEIEGTHLDLTQTAGGARRLASALDEEIAAGRRLTVLVASTFRWHGAARLAVELHALGCTVDGIAPRGSVVHSVAAVRRSHRLSTLRPVQSLGRAIEASGANLVVPFDDRTRHALTLLYRGTDARTPGGARVRELLERSLGAPEALAGVYSRTALMALARDAGVACPPTAALGAAPDIAAWFAARPGPAVMKTDGSWGGRGVKIVHDAVEAERAWRTLRRPSLVRTLKRLVVERDPWPLRERLARVSPTVSIQAYVAGRPANAAVSCLDGTTLSSVQGEVVESHGATGPSTVLRLVEHADISYAVKSVVSRLGLSGLCGLDFIVDDQGKAHLIELNPRATPTAHLVGLRGGDPLSALRAALGYEQPPPRVASYPEGLVALFPQELHRDPASPYLRLAHHDVPAGAPDFVAAVRGRRGLHVAAVSSRWSEA